MEKKKKEQKEIKEQIVVMNIKCDKELHTLLKIKAIKEQKTLKDLVLQILQKSITD